MATTTDGSNKKVDSKDTVLQKWAKLQHPERMIPPSLFLSATETTIAIVDKFPKAIFHALIFPRTQGNLREEDLEDLRALLGSHSRVPRERAKELLIAMGEHARKVRDEIKHDMRVIYKFEWDVWIGFHAVQAMSLVHLHMHVISSDLHNERMTDPKQYNSFHPKHGYFLHYDEVMSWFDAAPAVFQTKISGLGSRQYKEILEDPLSCYQCTRSFGNMHQLKNHLKAHHMAKYNAALKIYEREKKAAEATKPPSKASPRAILLKKRKHDGKPSSVGSRTSRAPGSSGPLHGGE
ncbi:hypothetical protein BDY19DRAFT_989440 [Irpex rosettiformis]|uniref:Uncharacterized protein n=1 Tax=Irpex rosettiformis TaxID=378272 RepID=A0ACB8UHS2_9APHY|nr:hypothetical protein BDY19DRAFT_989440 [Irpex rosettiformis]